MSKDRTNSWWELHLRKAMGQTLSDLEQKTYDAEVTRQDQTDTIKSNLAALKQLRDETTALAQQNDQLRMRAGALQAQIHRLEKALSKETRDLLGVQE